MYYIVGKKNREGTINSDTEHGNLNEYFELGWEYAVTHLYIKHMYVLNGLKHEDVIVTLKDRMFLYQGFWHNVISYEEFIVMNIDDSSIIDLCDKAEKERVGMIPKVIGDQYEFLNTDLDVIKKINLPDINHLPISDDYCCIHIRFRQYANYRNLSKKGWVDIINKLKVRYSKIFVFGKDTEYFCDNVNIISVSLSEYSALLNNKNCKFFVGTMSGGSLIAQLMCNKDCVNNIIITDQKTQNEFETKDVYQIFYHSEPFNFSKAPIYYIKYGELNNFINNL
jgi:hypothetical protein